MSNKIENEIVINIISLHSKIQEHIGGALSVHGLGLSEYLVLNQLYNDPNHKMRRSDLAKRVGLTPSGVTRLINPMEKTGLVEKEENPRDARVSLVALTATGKEIYEDSKVSFEYDSVKLFESLKLNQLSTFSEFLKTVL